MQWYLAVIASYDLPDMMSLIKVVWETEQIFFVVLSQDDSGTRIAKSLIRGADTFIIDPDKLIESLIKNRGIIERLSRLPAQNKQVLGILTHREIFMPIDYRKVFVRGMEVSLTKSEFKILQLLLSKAGWVFTHEQIYLYVYGDDVEGAITANAVRCHITMYTLAIGYALSTTRTRSGLELVRACPCRANKKSHQPL